jgi:hypothetical protein
MPEPKKPMDHQPKKADTSADEYFTFTVGGTEYKMPNRTLDKITFAFVRHNRRRDETDYVLTALEELSDGDEAIEKALDSMSRAESNEMLKAFTAHLGASLGD